MNPILYKKKQNLIKILRDMDDVLVAFSGGVDSTFLLAVAKEALGDKVLSVTAASETFPDREFQLAKSLAAELQVQHIETRVNELADAEFVNNDSNRCFHCKNGLYNHLLELVTEFRDRYTIVDGSIMDDLGEHRPGMQAARALGVRSPLQEANFYKEEIRTLSKEMGLRTWNKPSFACLSSRIPYGTAITKEKINQLDLAEDFLLGLGLYQVRVRHHDKIARIEVDQQDMKKVVDQHDKIVRALKSFGFSYVTLDLQGYRSGSMNEVLKEKASI
ncbi:ATP-dependent sacrificial sulfur transferase LarE [Lederbergia panacisoli]|uniref:ATP-dependent sacrificial sulfur transferase LarE n=1 Tax=Lederbergia panacisoli TaxID=1255251 RepID=UPI00214C069B|nr:ATP-dependent sacrificial sulfur transferase LarE [Lederbergia panacisoli]MCR2822584.1 ATP-dependent sacrificial sulfur transferase LarE [Lederbergia panacisoli]